MNSPLNLTTAKRLKIGDKIICIDNYGISANSLTLGKIYSFCGINSSNNIRIDTESRRGFYPKRFIKKSKLKLG